MGSRRSHRKWTEGRRTKISVRMRKGGDREQMPFVAKLASFDSPYVHHIRGNGAENCPFSRLLRPGGRTLQHHEVLQTKEGGPSPKDRPEGRVKQGIGDPGEKSEVDREYYGPRRSVGGVVFQDRAESKAREDEIRGQGCVGAEGVVLVKR